VGGGAPAAVTGGEAGIVWDVGDRVSRLWLARSRFADVVRLAELTLSLGPDAGAFYDRSTCGQAGGARSTHRPSFLSQPPAVTAGLGERNRLVHETWAHQESPDIPGGSGRRHRHRGKGRAARPTGVCPSELR
jgi:hypothetical protein